MTRDPLATKNLAALLAIGGLVVLMIQDRPNWQATCVATLCLIGYCGLWILSRWSPVRRMPARRIRVEIIPPDASDARRPRLLDGHPGELEFLSPGRPHPAPPLLSAPQER